MPLRVRLLSDWFGIGERLRAEPGVELVDDVAEADAFVCNRLTEGTLKTFGGLSTGPTGIFSPSARTAGQIVNAVALIYREPGLYEQIIDGRRPAQP